MASIVRGTVLCASLTLRCDRSVVVCHKIGEGGAGFPQSARRRLVVNLCVTLIHIESPETFPTYFTAKLPVVVRLKMGAEVVLAQERLVAELAPMSLLTDVDENMFSHVVLVVEPFAAVTTRKLPVVVVYGALMIGQQFDRLEQHVTCVALIRHLRCRFRMLMFVRPTSFTTSARREVHVGKFELPWFRWFGCGLWCLLRFCDVAAIVVVRVERSRLRLIVRIF